MMTWEDLKDESTLNLIDYIRSIDDSDYYELAQAAFVTFTFRFREDLINKCAVMCRKWSLTEDDAVELATRVFARFLKYPRFESTKCNSKNIDRCVKLYLYGIANKEIVSLHNPVQSPYDGTESLVTTLIDPEKEYSEKELRALKAYEARLDDIFSNLTPKHKIIFLTYKRYESIGHTLPRNLLAHMRDVLGLAQNTIGVYKMQAYELVNKSLKNG